MTPRIVATLVAFGASGCAAEPVAPPSTPPPAAASSTPAPSVSAPRFIVKPTPCEIIGSEQRKALSAFFDEHRRALGQIDPRDFLRETCWADAKGAWGLSFTSVTVVPSRVIKIPFPRDSTPDATGTMTVVRLSIDGTRATSAPRPLFFARAKPFDWNGDGVAELPMPTAERDLSDLEVLTATPAGVVPYEPAKGVRAREVQDVDGDERPDLMYTHPYDGNFAILEGIDTGRVVGMDDGGFWLAAHSRPDGSFSRDDDAAIAFAKKGCPDGDFDEKFEDPSGERSLSIARQVRCARLWGKSQKVVDTFLDKHCKPKNPCADLKMLRAWAAATPPITLK